MMREYLARQPHAAAGPAAREAIVQELIAVAHEAPPVKGAGAATPRAGLKFGAAGEARPARARRRSGGACGPCPASQARPPRANPPVRNVFRLWSNVARDVIAV